MKLWRPIAGTAILLGIPAVASLFTREVNWGLGDYVIAAALLLAAGFTYEVLATRLRPASRPLAGAVILGVLALVWAEMAVGIFH